jgi:uncharacterized repeat protein (TIGR02543 family)
MLRKITLTTLASILFVIGTFTVSPEVSAQVMTFREFIYLLINIGAIPADKIPAINAYFLSSVDIISTSTTSIIATSTTRHHHHRTRSTYSVTYNGNYSTGGSAPVDSNSYQINTSVTVLENSNFLTRDGHTFNSWNTQADGLGISYSPSATFEMGNGNITLYAIWTPNATYSITYDGNGSILGTIPVDFGTYEQNATTTVLGNPGMLVKDGYDFDGWNTSADGLGTNYASSSTLTMGTTSVILYANWELITHTVSGSITWAGIWDGGVFTWPVIFVAKDGSGLELKRWSAQDVIFTTGLGVYTLDVPQIATTLSLKVPWALRKKVSITPGADPLTVNFSVDMGDINDSANINAQDILLEGFNMHDLTGDGIYSDEVDKAIVQANSLKTGDLE